MIVDLPADILPFVGGKMAEGRQIAMVLFAHGFQLTQSLVDFRTLHSLFSFTINIHIRTRGILLWILAEKHIITVPFQHIFVKWMHLNRYNCHSKKACYYGM